MFDNFHDTPSEKARCGTLQFLFGLWVSGLLALLVIVIILVIKIVSKQ